MNAKLWTNAFLQTEKVTHTATKFWLNANSILGKVDRKLRLRLHGIGYVQIRLESDPIWYGSTLFTPDWL